MQDSGRLVVVCTKRTFSPESIPGATKWMQRVEMTPRLVVIDPRIAMDRNQGHLEGSLSLPGMETSCAAFVRIIPENDRLTLFYGNDVKCGHSGVALKITGHAAIPVSIGIAAGSKTGSRKIIPA